MFLLIQKIIKNNAGLKKQVKKNQLQLKKKNQQKRILSNL